MENNPLFTITYMKAIQIFSFLSLIFLLTGVASCQQHKDQSTQKQESMAFENLPVDDFKEKLAGHSNAVVLDVRTPEEVAAGAIEGAEVINIFDADFAERIEKLDKSKAYFIYCRSGRRSENACGIMSQKGFKELYNLEGGYMAWEANGY